MQFVLSSVLLVFIPFLSALRLGPQQGGMQLQTERGSGKNVKIHSPKSEASYVNIMCNCKDCQVEGSPGTSVTIIRGQKSTTAAYSVEKGCKGKKRLKAKLGDSICVLFSDYTSLSKIFKEQANRIAATPMAVGKSIPRLNIEEIYDVIVFPVIEDEEK